MNTNAIRKTYKGRLVLDMPSLGLEGGKVYRKEHLDKWRR